MNDIVIVVAQKDGSLFSESELVSTFHYIKEAIPKSVLKVKNAKSGMIERVRNFFRNDNESIHYILIPEESIHVSVDLVGRLLDLLDEGCDRLIYETKLRFPTINFYMVKDRCLAFSSRMLKEMKWEDIINESLNTGCPKEFSIPKYETDVLLKIRERYFDTKPLPETIIIEPASSCNFHCRMCPYHGAEGINTPSFIPDESGSMMELDRFIEIVDQINDCKPKSMLIVTQQRGEPLLNSDLPQMIRHIHKNNALRVSFSTNGYHLRGDVAQRLIEEQLDEVYISLHANTAETAKRLGVGSDFTVVEENIVNFIKLKKEMKSTLPRVGLKFVHQEENDHELMDYVKKWVSLGLTVAVCNKDRYAMEDEQQWVYDDLYRIPVISKALANIPCFIPIAMPIYVDGTVRLCYGTFKNEFVIGNVFETSLRSIIYGEKRAELLQKSNMGKESIKPCNKCELRMGNLYFEGKLNGFRVTGNPVMIHFYPE